MQASVAGEIASRVELFQDGFAFCRQGGFSFARFLALVPDRLRLAVGDQGHRIRIPVTVAPDVGPVLSARLPRWSEDVRPAVVGSPVELRRVLRLAQLDSGIDPIGLWAWLGEHGEALVSRLAGLYERGLAEVGRGEGGAETAYLVHLMIVELVRRQLDAAAVRRSEAAGLSDQGRLVASVLMTSFFDAALEGALGRDDVDDRPLSPRLGYQMAATRSAAAFGADVDSLAARPVNAYRTNPRAVQLVRRVLQPPVEVIPLARVADTVAKRLLVEPTLVTGLLKDILLEMVRDAALAAVMQSYDPGGGGMSDVLRPLLQSSTQLVQTVFNHPRRRQFLARLRPYTAAGPRAVGALVELLDGAPAVELGDGAPLGVHGSAPERALLAARGAICLVLDAHTEDLKRDVNALVEWVRPEEARMAVLEGRCYRLGLDSMPLFRLPPRDREAFVFVDARELVRRAADRRATAVGDLMSRYFMTPLLESYRAIRDAEPEALRLVHLGVDQVAFAGDIEVTVELAVAVRGVIDGLQRELKRPVADVLGGRPSLVDEADEEIRSLEGRLEQVDGALRRSSSNEESMRLLEDSKLMLERRLEILSESRRRTGGVGSDEDVDVGIFIAHGAVAVRVPLPRDIVSDDGLWFSPHLSEARWACARTPWVRLDRRSQLFLRRRIRADAEPLLPFAVSLRIREDRTAVFNAGCGLSEAALKALLRSRAIVMRFLELQVELRQLPEWARRRFVFDRDPERFVLCIARHTDELVHAFRYVGRHRSSTLWELVAADSPFIEVLLEFVPRAQEITDEQI